MTLQPDQDAAAVPSTPETPASRRRRPLRTTLLAIVSLCVAGACLLIGVLTHVSLTVTLESQADAELARAVERSQRFGPDPGAGSSTAGPGTTASDGGSTDSGTAGSGDGTAGATAMPSPPTGSPSAPPGPPDFVLAPGQGEYALGAVIVDGSVVQGGWVDAAGQSHSLTDADAEALLNVRVDEPRNLRLGIGSYRVLAHERSDGSIVVVGVSREQSQRTLLRLDLTLGGVGLAALLLAALAGTLAVRRSLRPLEDVARVADSVAEQDLATGESSTTRVSRTIAQGTDEVGRVAHALNTMLDNVDDALETRRRSEEQLSRFVADASHELRTPLTVMGGYLDMIDPGDPEQARGALDRVCAQTRRMSALVEDLLLLARLEKAEPVAPEIVDLGELALDLVTDAQVAATDHVFLVELGEGDEGDLEVLAVRSHVERILVNLLSNASKHTPAGTTVTVDLRPEPHAVHLIVRDDGPGMEPEFLARIFDRFSRADAARSSRRDGEGTSGLGMALVKALAEASGGDVTVAAEPGAGTAVTVTLPRARPVRRA